MRLLTTFILLTIYLTATGQISPTKKESWFRVDTSYAINGKSQKKLTHYSYEWIDTEVKYCDSTRKGVIIQNSLPRGGFSPTLILWTRVINETATPFELTINFSADSFGILPSPYAYLYLPPDTMNVEKDLFDYGVTGLKSLDAGTNKPTKLKRTINPKQEYLFYIGLFIKMNDGHAPARAGLVLKGQQLFYNIRGLARELDSVLIPCGQIIFKK